MNILCSSDRNFLYPLENLLFSLKETQSEDLHIYFLGIDISQEIKEELKTFCEKLQLKISVCENLPLTSLNFLKSLTLSKGAFLKSQGLSINTYFRLFLTDFLPEDIDRILWLDADCLVQKDLRDFYHISFEKNLIAAADTCTFPQKEELLQENSTLYEKFPSVNRHFNAGVILFNLKEIRKENILALRKVASSILSKTVFNDQSSLNFLFKNRVLWVHPYLYNFPINRGFLGDLQSDEAYQLLLKKAYILHYANIFKPWLSDENSLGNIIWKENEKRMIHQTQFTFPFKERCLLPSMLNKIEIPSPQSEKVIERWLDFSSENDRVFYSGQFKKDTLFSDNKEFLENKDFQKENFYLNFKLQNSKEFKVRNIEKDSIWGLIKWKTSDSTLKDRICKSIKQILSSKLRKEVMPSKEGELFLGNKKLVAMSSIWETTERFTGWVIYYFIHSLVEKDDPMRKHEQIGLLNIDKNLSLEEVERDVYLSIRGCLIKES